MREWMTALFELGVAASLTALAVLALSMLLRPLSKKYVYLLWLAVFVRAVCPFSYTSPFSVFRLFSFMRTEGSQLTVAAGSGQAVRLAGILGLKSAGEGAAAWPAAGGTLAGGGTGAAAQAGADFGALPGAGAGETLLTALLCVWAAGVLFLLAWGLFSWIRLRRRIALAVRAGDGAYESDQISTAFVLGFFRPRIYLPAGLSGKKREYVLRHERIHIRRRDPQLKLLAWLAAALHWWNPFLWLAFSLFVRDMEMSCDERVLDEIGAEQKENYGEFLLALAAPAGFPAGSPLAFGETSVRARIRSILKYKKRKRIIAALALLLVLAGLWLCLSNPSGQEAVSIIGGADGPTSVWVAGRGELPGASEEEQLTAIVQLWAAAAGNRNADYVYERLTPGLQARADELGIERVPGAGEGEEILTMGWSSPFLADTPIVKLSVSEPVTAEITYPGLTSDGNWWAWKDYITLERTEDAWLISEWERKEFFSITSYEDFREAYEDWLPDYLNSSLAGEDIAENLVQKDLAGEDPEYYEKTFHTPAAALEWALHLEGGETETQMQEEGKALVTYRFSDGEIEAQMVQPGLSDGSGVWLPEAVVF